MSGSRGINPLTVASRVHWQARMLRLATLVAAVFGTSALATGEHLAFSTKHPALEEALCVSMECGPGRAEFTVATRVVKAGLEVSLTTVAGKRATFIGAFGPDGTLSSTELVHLTSLVLKAIEEGLPDPKPVVKAPRKRVPSSRRHLLVRR